MAITEEREGSMSNNRHLFCYLNLLLLLLFANVKLGKG